MCAGGRYVISKGDGLRSLLTKVGSRRKRIMATVELHKEAQKVRHHTRSVELTSIRWMQINASAALSFESSMKRWFVLLQSDRLRKRPQRLVETMGEAEKPVVPESHDEVRERDRDSLIGSSR